MRYVATITLGALLACSNTAQGSTFEERRAFMQEHRALATAIGIMKFCKNSGLEKALVDKAGRYIVMDKLKSVSSGSENGSEEYLDSEEYVQALDFHAVGVAIGLKISGIPPAAQKNICTLGVELADKLLAPSSGP